MLAPGIWHTLADLTRLALCALAATGIACIVCAVGVTAYRLFLHPLANIPGPRAAAVSNTWHALRVRDGRARLLATTLHQKYGAAVRVGPDEVWFSTTEAFDKIYVATSLSKPQLDAWLRPHFPDSLDLLSELDTKRYRLQRRLIGRTYHASNVARYEAAIDSVLERATAKLASLRGREVDLTEWMHIIAVECLGACVLSWSPGLLSDGTDGGTIAHSYHGWRKKSVFGLFPAMTKLELLSPGAGRVFSALFGVTYRTPANFKTFFPHVAKRVSRRIKAALRPDPAKDDRTDLLADLIQLHKDKPAFSETYLKKMAVTNFGAGHETMASTLTSVLAMLATHPESQRRAVAEARAAPGPTAYADAASTPFTRAAIKEAMRLHPVIAMSLPRRAPPGGLQVQQHWIPAGTTVGCSPVALHRNRAVFGADAERFDPRRWLDAGARRAMDRYNLCWGGGSRSCPGRSLAELVVFKAVAALLARFDVQVVAMPRDEEQRSYFLSVMTGVTVRFLAVGE